MRQVQSNAPARATAVDGEQGVGEAPYNGVVTSVSYTPEAAITGQDTDTRRLSLVNRGQSGGGTVEVAALAFTAGVNAAANDEKQLTLSATHSNRAVVKGDQLELVSDAQGTGLADPGGLVQIEFESR